MYYVKCPFVGCISTREKNATVKRGEQKRMDAKQRANLLNLIRLEKEKGPQVREHRANQVKKYSAHSITKRLSVVK